MNRYSKTYHINKTLYPNVFSVIKALPDKWIFCDKHKPELRHPGAILNRATDEIVEYFLRVLKGLDILSAMTDIKEKGNGAKELLQDMANLFGHFDSFQDECYLILKSLSPVPFPDKAPGEKAASEWLRRNDYNCSSDFLGRTHNIQQLIDCFSNRLKHANQKLDFVTVKAGDIIIDGFFIEELKGKEITKVYQPLPQEQSNATIAISFNSMLKTLLLCFYELCDALEKSIKKHIKILHGEDFTKREIVKHSENYIKVIDLIAEIDEYFYPYEYKKFPRIIKSGEAYIISYPHSSRIPYTGPLQATSIHTADGYTRAFSLPFFG